MPGKEFFDKQVSIQWVLGAVATSILFCTGTVWSFSSNWTKLNDKMDHMIDQQTDTARRDEVRNSRQEAIASAQEARLSAVERGIDRHDFRLDNVERVLQLKIPVRK